MVREDTIRSLLDASQTNHSNWKYEIDDKGNKFRLYEETPNFFFKIATPYFTTNIIDPKSGRWLPNYTGHMFSAFRNCIPLSLHSRQQRIHHAHISPKVLKQNAQTSTLHEYHNWWILCECQGPGCQVQFRITGTFDFTQENVICNVHFDKLRACSHLEYLYGHARAIDKESAKLFDLGPHQTSQQMLTNMTDEQFKSLNRSGATNNKALRYYASKVRTQLQEHPDLLVSIVETADSLRQKDILMTPEDELSKRHFFGSVFGIILDPPTTIHTLERKMYQSSFIYWMLLLACWIIRSIMFVGLIMTMMFDAALVRLYHEMKSKLPGLFMDCSGKEGKHVRNSY